MLRYKDPTGSSHWIAAREEEENGEDTWSIWWVSPNAANKDDFEHYVPIDIELVSV